MRGPSFDDAWRRCQYLLQLVQVFFVGLTLGMTRTVVPVVAESEFGVPRGDVALIATFVIAFGLVKGVMNFIAGALSETLGRKRVLVIGWLVALPIPWLIWFAPSGQGGWWWIVAATVLLGVNQGLTWSMTLTSKLDLTRAHRRGLTNGLNEFSGYFAVAIAGVVTGYMSEWLGPRAGLLAFGLAVIVPALMMAIVLVRETRAVRWDEAVSPSLEGIGQGGGSSAANVEQRSAAEQRAGAEPRAETSSAPDPPPDPLPRGRGELRTREVFALSLRDRTFFAVCQAGLFEKFIDALMWVALPVYLHARGVDLRHIGWTPGVYATTWGVSQIVTGALSDRIGRKPLIVGGMLLCALGAAALPISSGAAWWAACAAVAGFGMAMLYPTLGASVSDLADASWRGAALGVYRFWRDLGYAAGAGALALCAASGFDLRACFWVVALCVAASGLLMWTLGAETRPRAIN